MRDRLLHLIAWLRRQGVDYADVRWVTERHQRIVVENSVVEAISDHFDEGYGIRVLLNGHWGFASSHLFDAPRLEDTARQAMEIAKASQLINTAKAVFPPYPPVKGTYATAFRVDPFTVPLDRKIDELMRTCEILHSKPQISFATGTLEFYRTEKLFLNTEGSDIHQTVVESGGYVEALASDAEETQKRSYPISHHSQLAQKGYETIHELGFPKEAARIRDEAISLLDAPECPRKETTILLDGYQTALQLHESCGHPVELDRILGDEISYAGGSFLRPEHLGQLRYGSRLVNVTADATLAGGIGTFGYDDEGVPAQRIEVVRQGIFTGYLSSRESAARLGQRSNGTMRASSWNRIPLVRMTNVNLEPGDATVEELIRDTKEGLFLATNKSWSIDDLRINFHFGCEIAWDIRNGRLGQVYKNPYYGSTTTTFWNSCSGIAHRPQWVLWGIPNCGKGEPGQTMHVGHGTAPARFERVTVGVLR